jgi:hypothetical protein
MKTLLSMTTVMPQPAAAGGVTAELGHEVVLADAQPFGSLGMTVSGREITIRQRRTILKRVWTNRSSAKSRQMALNGPG